MNLLENKKRSNADKNINELLNKNAYVYENLSTNSPAIPFPINAAVPIEK